MMQLNVISSLYLGESICTLRKALPRKLALIMFQLFSVYASLALIVHTACLKAEFVEKNELSSCSGALRH